jgi:hypothetical protein
MVIVGWVGSVKVSSFVECLICIKYLILQPERVYSNERSGEKYIVARKLIKGSAALVYVTTEMEYNLHSEDVRIVNMKHSKVKVRKSTRNPAQASNKDTYLFEEDEMDTLKEMCWKPLN